MPYLGNSHIAGDQINNFKVLDDISSHTSTFDGSASGVVSTSDNTIRIAEHRFVQGQRVTYNNGGGGNIGNLSSGTAYYVIKDTNNTIKLATSLSDANNSTAINLSVLGSGSSHTLNVAFDGVNTKFKVTHNGGTPGRINNATQLSLAINNVIQRPNQNVATFTEGFAIEDQHKIIFKVAPVSSDIFWGSILANTLPTFDITDNKIDNFTGDGSTTEFNLSNIPASNKSIMVTINGVLQHPSDGSTSRSYTLLSNILQFTAAPGNGDEIQVRHIGFAGASTSDVTGFYGRTGNVVLTSNDHITTGNINAGVVTATTFVGNLTGNVSGNLTVGGVLTYEDVTNVDSIGIITARSGFKVLAGGANVVGVITARTNIHLEDYIHHLGDLTTKIGFPAANTFTVDTAGDERLRITSTGNIGIGTNNPVTKLHVESTTGTTTYATISQQKTYGSGTGTAERSGLNLAIREVAQAANNRIFGRIEVGTNSETDSSNGFMSFFTRQSGGISERLRIQADGDVSFGDETTGNAQIKHLSGNQSDRNNGGFPQYAFVGNEGTGMRRVSSNVLAFDTNGAQRVLITSTGDVAINRSAQLNTAKFSLTKDPDQQGIGVQLNQSSGITTSLAAYNSSGTNIFDLAHDTDSTPDLLFKLKHSSDALPVEKLRITSDGKLGLGVAVPLAQMHIEGGSNGNLIQLTNDQTGATSSDGFVIGINATEAYFYHRETKHIKFGTANVEKLRITSDGKLGLGVATPQAAMHIEGGSNGNLLQLSNTNTGATSSDGFVIGINSLLTYVYNRENKDLTFGTNNTERLRITSTGQTLLTRGSQGGRDSTGNASNFMKIGTWYGIDQTSRLKITIFGTLTYDSNADVAGETIIYISNNANNTMKGHFHSHTNNRAGVQKVAFKYDSSASPTSCEVWIKYNGGYSCTQHKVDASEGYWVGADVDTSSTSVPSGATEASSFFAVATSDGSQSYERLRIGSSGQIGLSGTNYGNSGQVLTSQGGSSAPTWTTVASGGASNISFNSGNGIDFSATADGTGSSSPSELLDDYESGEWTGSINTGTANINNAWYVKIGKLVVGGASITAISDTSSSNSIIVNGLPFSNSGGNSGRGAVSASKNNKFDRMVDCYVSGTTVRFMVSSLSTGSHDYLRHSSVVQSSGSITFGFNYQTA